MKHSVIDIGAVVAFAALWLAIVGAAGQMTPFVQALGAVSIIILLVHAIVAFGWFEACAFAAICLVVAFSVENLGALTGFPFGQYTFLVGSNLPRIGVIPLIVGPLYLGMGYCSWIIANFVLSVNGRRPSSVLELVALPIAAGFIMVQWDVVMDPSGSTLNRAWVWHRGGGYFGVPLTNFLGWFLLTYAYFQSFAVVLYARRKKAPYQNRSRMFWLIPVLLYLAAGFCYIPLLFNTDTVLTDESGRMWLASNLREAAVIVMLFTMFPSALLAFYQIVRSNTPKSTTSSPRASTPLI
jgi:putative membrane protein